MSPTPGLQLVDPKPLAQRQLKVLTAGLSEERQGFPPLEFVKLSNYKLSLRSPVRCCSIRNLPPEFSTTRSTRPLSLWIHCHSRPVQFPSRGYLYSGLDDRINVNELNNLLRRAETKICLAHSNYWFSVLETATGDKRCLRTAGVAVGLERAVHLLLWAVEDESTALPLSHFYQELKTG